MRIGATLLVAALLVVAGCSALNTSDGGQPTATPEQTAVAPDDGPTDRTENMADPASDRIGWESGYWYNESIDATNDGGLNESEFEAVLGRTQARVELLRQKEFTDDVDVKQIRLDQSPGQIRPEEGAAFMKFEDVRYEALFFVGDQINGREMFWNGLGNRGAFYDYWNNSAVLLVTNASQPQVLPWRFSHELAHALQDQQFNLTDFIAHPTMDGSYARRGIVEGGAKLVGDRYAERCRTGEWDCLGEPERPYVESDPAHTGWLQLQYVWYEHGKAFLWPHFQQGGWEAVDQFYETPPASTEQLINPSDYPDDTPVEVSLEDNTSDGWERIRPDRGFPYQERPAFARNGQAAIAITFGQTVADELPNTPYDVYNESGVLNISNVTYSNWSQDPTKVHADFNFSYVEGWDGDRLHAYQNGNETGYVWRIVWESSADAREFREGYRNVLEHWGANRAGNGTWRIADDLSPYDGNAYRVSVEGDTVTIVNAPTVGELDEVYGHAGG